MLKQLMLGCCKLYISESRSKQALEAIERAAWLHPEVVVINKFEDEAYNRVGYTLVSHIPPTTSVDTNGLLLPKVVFGMVKSALESIDLRHHLGSHPRLGVVDHLCFHPLAGSSLPQVSGLAKTVAKEIGVKLQVPTYLYGAAHELGRTLDSIRRELGYFSPNAKGNQWAGGLASATLSLQPDAGPHQVPKSTGVVVVGATDWVDNYNVPVFSSNIAVVRGIAKRVSGRGGGLKSVQAMALSHGEDLTEIACNLLDSRNIGGAQVQSEVERLAREAKISVGKGYFTDFSREEIIQKYLSSD